MKLILLTVIQIQFVLRDVDVQVVLHGNKCNQVHVYKHVENVIVKK